MKWLSNRKAEGITAGTIVMLAVGFLMVAILTPIALTALFESKGNATHGWAQWSPAVVTIFSVLLPILFIIGVAIRYIPRGGKGAWLSNKKAEGVTAGTIVMLAVGFLLVAILTPIAMEQVVGANTDLWGTALKTIFTVLLPILFIIGVAIRYIPRGGK